MKRNERERAGLGIYGGTIRERAMNKRACRVCGRTFGDRDGLGINMITKSEEDDTICMNCEEEAPK